MPRTRTELSKHWCFTINNPVEGDCEWNPEQMSYLIMAHEVAPDTGTPHLQCYVAFLTRKRLTQAKVFFPRSHLERMRGTPRQASDYCKKDDAYHEFGTLPQTPSSGARLALMQKWDDAYALARQGNFDNIPKDMLTKYYHAWKRIYQDNPIKPPDLDHRENLWIVAPTGYGKSFYARKKYPDYYDKAPNKWWIGYLNEETVLCDDFGPDQCKYLGWYMKRWADVYSFPMETKGGGRQIRPPHIVVTSQYTIEDCFGEDERTCAAILNRFTVLHLTPWQQREEEARQERLHDIEFLVADEVLEAHGANDPTEDTESYGIYTIDDPSQSVDLN